MGHVPPRPPSTAFGTGEPSYPCLDIYNYEVVNGVATLDLEPRTLPEWKEWYESHSDEHHPIVVGTVDGIVAGYASLSPYRPKEAYKSTVELSIYIHQNYRGRGIATQLMLIF